MHCPGKNVLNVAGSQHTPNVVDLCQSSAWPWPLKLTTWVRLFRQDTAFDRGSSHWCTRTYVLGGRGSPCLSSSVSTIVPGDHIRWPSWWSTSLFCGWPRSSPGMGSYCLDRWFIQGHGGLASRLQVESDRANHHNSHHDTWWFQIPWWDMKQSPLGRFLSSETLHDLLHHLYSSHLCLSSTLHQFLWGLYSALGGVVSDMLIREENARCASLESLLYDFCLFVWCTKMKSRLTLYLQTQSQ